MLLSVGIDSIFHFSHDNKSLGGNDGLLLDEMIVCALNSITWKKTAKTTGHEVEKTTNKGTNRTAQKTKHGARKVEDKTQPN